MRTPFIDSIAYGTTLGDSYICPHGCIRTEQSIIHKEYIEWLYLQLSPVCTNNGIQPMRKKNGTSSLRFNTRTLFRDMREDFYGTEPYGKKHIPFNFESTLNEYILAIWFMDDGGRSYGVRPGAGAVLHINCYTAAEGKRIQQALFDRFGVSCSIHRSRPSHGRSVDQHRLYFGIKNYSKFYDVVFPVVAQIPEMLRRKLPVPVKPVK